MENKTLFGELPLGWKHVALSDVTTFISRGRQPKYIASVEGIPVINQKMIRNFTIDYRYVKYNDAKKNINKSVFIKIGDTLVNSTGVGTVGRSAYISIDPMRPTFVDSHVTIVRPDTAIVDPKFMSVVLSSDVYSNYMGSTLAQGSTGQVELSRQKLSKMCIPFPPLNTQHLIGTIFDLIDQKIKLNQQINKNLLRLCRIQFDRVKLACSSTTDLSNIAVLMMGQSPKGNTYNQKGEGIPLLNGAADFRGGINPSKYTSDPKKVTKPGDYVFGIRATIGLTTKVFGCYAIGRGTGLARSLNSEFDELLYFILEDSFDYFAHAATGSVYLNISRKDFETYSAPAFSGHSQKVFHDFASPLMEKIYQDETQNKKLTQIRDILLPKLLSGSVDLSGIEEAMKNA
ncbi:restriction endonuclease subunit S [Lactobacillus helveticus]|uniref:restriction endonuclease subunit S n=1 Tax=Lactobacillus helveticus TaxID=1587 RepID=UPI001562AA46|nr:restriction endonuclease subunit S [Lactobacillus helveticus]NRO26980.1 hypothetical protein [Lactobacillus helveticus]